MAARAPALGHDSRRRGAVCAITFDVDAARMEEPCSGASRRDGHGRIGRILSEHGFDRKRGSVCLGDDGVNAVTCVPAVQDASRKPDWFGASVRDLRMPRIGEPDDLGPAVGKPET